MENVLITGAYGQLGKALREQMNDYPNFSCFFSDIDTLDITDKEALMAYVSENKIHAIINAAAYTAVDKAETEPLLVQQINGDAVRNLGEVACNHHCKLIHISTDYVFDGMNHTPYVETDATHPLSVYGKTKLAGERMLQQVLPEAIIIRTSWLYSKTGSNFMKTMQRLGKERKEIGVVFDQIGTPTYAGDLASVLFSILQREKKGGFVPGVFHYSNEGVCSWYDFARKIMELTGLPCRVLPIETKDFPTSANRPSYSLLCKTKIKETYNIDIPHWEESLKKVIESQTEEL